jgi:HemX protein
MVVLFWICWIVITVTLAAGRFVRQSYVEYILNGAAALALIFQFFLLAREIVLPADWNIPGKLLIAHIVLSLGSYAAFALGAVWSGMYLFLHRRLKEKNWTSSLRRMPSLERLELYTLRTCAIGVPLLLLAIILGIAWLFLLEEHSFIMDWKVVNSLIVLGLYAYYMVCSVTRRIPGQRLAVWNMLAFLFVLINLVWSNWLSEFHHWVWM